MSRPDTARARGVPDTPKRYRNISEEYNGRWRAWILLKDPKRTMRLGTFETEEEAARARDAAAKIHRPDLPLNFPENPE